MVDVANLLRRARENAAKTTGYTGYTGYTVNDTNEINDLPTGDVVTPSPSAGVTTGYICNPCDQPGKGVTDKGLHKNQCENKELGYAVTPATPVTPILGSTPEQFPAAIQTVWPEARMLTEAEQSEDTQFREQLILLREENAKVYANLTPWKRK